MPRPLLNTAKAWDVAIEETRKIRRDRLERVIRTQRLRAGTVFAFAAGGALFALAAMVYGDFKAAGVVGSMALIVFGFGCLAWHVGRKKAAELKREMEHSGSP